jgi:ferredoxin
VISITSPYSGLVWSGGSVHPITWNSNAKDIGNCQVTLSYSTDDFEDSDEPIVSLAPDTGSYNWTLPLINSGSVRLKAVTRDPNGQTSQDVSESFKIDSTAPNVVSVEPPRGLENVNASAFLSITFSESVLTSTAEQAFSLNPETSGISWSWGSQQRTMTANVLLSPNTTYTAAIGAGFTDSSDPGNTNSQAFTWSFTTGYAMGSTVTKSDQPPVIILEIQEPQILVNEPATFNASKTFDPDNDALVFSWDFGHNTTVVESNNPVEVHSFPADGTYNVLLKVSDGNVESLQAMEVLVRKPQTAEANTASSSDWHVVWAGLLISVVGMIGVGRSAFLGRTEPPTIMTDPTSEQAIRAAPCVSSVLPTLLLQTENCVGCGLCSKKCPNNAITMINKRPAHDPAKCHACMECVKGCARGSITITSQTLPVAPAASPGR